MRGSPEVVRYSVLPAKMGVESLKPRSVVLASKLSDSDDMVTPHNGSIGNLLQRRASGAEIAPEDVLADPVGGKLGLRLVESDQHAGGTQVMF